MTALSATGGTYRGHFTAAGDDFTPVSQNTPSGDVRIHIASFRDLEEAEKLADAVGAVLMRRMRPT